MNILYISKLDGRPWIGPTYSVPKQIAAQTKYDNVLWYNLISKDSLNGEETLNEWRQLSYYKDLLDFPKGEIKSLPQPFNKPDLIVVEQNYPYATDKIRYEILKSNIPYIIIPRGELTLMAQNKKKLKKIFGNIILRYYRFINNAVALQLLNEEEKKETSNSWNNKIIVLPNGTDILDGNKDKVVSDGIKCVFIGRIEPYQKGIDLLIQACIDIKDELIKEKCTISIYGSDQENKARHMKEIVEVNGISEIIKFYDPIFNEQKKEVLQSSDVFLLTSRFEGHPTGLLEALAYGLPCLVTKGTNMRQEIEEFNAGWGAENTVDSIRNSLLTMLSDKSTILKKGNNARKLAENYSWDTIAQKSHMAYEELINGK